MNLAFDDFIYENERMKILRDGKGKPSLSGCEISWKSFKDVEHVYTDVFGVPQVRATTRSINKRTNIN